MAKKNVIVDGINLNTEHFGKMPEADAVKSMIADGIQIPGNTDTDKQNWAKKAHGLIMAEFNKNEGTVPSSGILKGDAKAGEQSGEAKFK